MTTTSVERRIFFSPAPIWLCFFYRKYVDENMKWVHFGSSICRHHCRLFPPKEAATALRLSVNNIDTFVMDERGSYTGCNVSLNSVRLICTRAAAASVSGVFFPIFIFVLSSFSKCQSIVYDIYSICRKIYFQKWTTLVQSKLFLYIKSDEYYLITFAKQSNGIGGQILGRRIDRRCRLCSLFTQSSICTAESNRCHTGIYRVWNVWILAF